MQKAVTAEQFSSELKRYTKRTVLKQILEAHGIVVFEIYKYILERTPVLSGRARRNWNVSMNAPNPETTEETAQTFTTGTPMETAERQRAVSVLKNLEYGKLGTTVWISNHLVYVAGLEAGTSMKAPNGIVEGAILGALEALRSKVAKIQL
jgi:hypothetical protein